MFRGDNEYLVGISEYKVRLPYILEIFVMMVLCHWEANDNVLNIFLKLLAKERSNIFT